MVTFEYDLYFSKFILKFSKLEKSLQIRNFS